MDDFMVFQLGNDVWDNICEHPNEMHYGWKTKSALLPNFKEQDMGLKDSFIGGSTDIGDNGFVFSFHIHEKHRIKCEQWIKSQKMPFLPYQLIDIWPKYFNEKFNKIDEKKYNKETIYEEWKLNTKDPRLMKWIKIIDPVFYEHLKDLHLQFEK